MSRRILEQLNTTKQKKIDVLRGYPNPGEGVNGELQIRIIANKGVMLFSKVNSRWYSTPLTINHVSPEEERVVLEQGRYPKFAGELAMNNDGNITYKQTGNGDTKEIVESAGTYSNLRAQATTQADVGLGNVDNESKETMFTSPTFTGNIASTAMTSFTIDGSNDSAASLYIRGGINDGEAALYIYPDKGGEAQDKFKIYATNGASAGHATEGLRFAKMDSSDGSWIDTMRITYGGDDADESTINVYSPISSDQNMTSTATITGANLTTAGTVTGADFIGTTIWQRFQFYIIGGDTSRFYYLDHDDRYSSLAHWDNYSTVLGAGSDLTMLDERMAAFPEFAEDCEFAGGVGTIYNDTGTDNPKISIFYDEGALSGNEDQSEAFASLVDTDVTINTQDRKYGFTLGAVTGTTLREGGKYVPTVSNIATTVWGSMTLKFITK